MTAEGIGRAKRERKGGLGVVTAAVVLAVVVAGVGAVGFVVLSAFGANHSSTTTVHDCSPPTLPQCQGITNSTGQVAVSFSAEAAVPR